MEREANLNETNLTAAYRQARRDFISACEGLGADVIARVHPERGPDGKPLFCDCAAFGPRGARHALLVIAGAETIIALLRTSSVPAGARLVVVHDPDPYARVWGANSLEAAADWPGKMLAAIATEDLARVKKLTVLDLSGGTGEAILEKALPGAAIAFRAVRPEHAEQAFLAAIAGL